MAPEGENGCRRRGGRCTKNEKSLDFSRLLLVGLVGLEPMSAIRNRVSTFAFACRKPFAHWAFASLHHPLGALGSGPPTIVGTMVQRSPIRTKKPLTRSGFFLVGLVGLEPMTPTMSMKLYTTQIMRKLKENNEKKGIKQEECKRNK